MRHRASEPLIYGVFKVHADEHSGTSTCLETDTDGDPGCNKMIKNKRSCTYSSSSDVLDNQSEWDENEEIIFHELTELDVSESEETNEEELWERRRCKRIKLEDEITEPPQEIEDDPTMLKYWLNRYELFHKYDDGIQLDKGKFYIYI